MEERVIEKERERENESHGSIERNVILLPNINNLGNQSQPSPVNKFSIIIWVPRFYYYIIFK